MESKWVGVRAGGVGAKVRGWVHEVGRQRWRQRWKQRWRAGKQEQVGAGEQEQAGKRVGKWVRAGVCQWQRGRG